MTSVIKLREYRNIGKETNEERENKTMYVSGWWGKLFSVVGGEAKRSNNVGRESWRSSLLVIHSDRMD